MFLRPIGLRTLEISFQHTREPARCHGAAVFEMATISDCFHPDQNRRANTQNSLSNTVSLGLGCVHFSAGKCWLEAKFSSGSLRQLRNHGRITPARRPIAYTMCRYYRTPVAE